MDQNDFNVLYISFWNNNNNKTRTKFNDKNDLNFGYNIYASIDQILKSSKTLSFKNKFMKLVSFVYVYMYTLTYLYYCLMKISLVF